jgi:hypothetical protein
MFAPDKAPRRARRISTVSHRRAFWCTATTVAAAIAISALAASIVMAQTPAQQGSHVAAPGVRLVPVYQMRCWQEGQLVLEEPLTQAPAESPANSIRLQGSQGAGTAVMLLSAGTTTCLVKPSRER